MQGDYSVRMGSGACGGGDQDGEDIQRRNLVLDTLVFAYRCFVFFRCRTTAIRTFHLRLLQFTSYLRHRFVDFLLDMELAHLMRNTGKYGTNRLRIERGTVCRNAPHDKASCNQNFMERMKEFQSNYSAEFLIACASEGNFFVLRK